MEKSFSVYSGHMGFCDKILYYKLDQPFTADDVMMSFETISSKRDIEKTLAYMADLGFICEIPGPTGLKTYKFTPDNETIERLKESAQLLIAKISVINEFISEIEQRHSDILQEQSHG